MLLFSITGIVSLRVMGSWQVKSDRRWRDCLGANPDGAQCECRKAGGVSPNPFDDLPLQIKTKIAITCALLVAANIAAWAWALIEFVDRPVLLGTAFLAYMFGLRHAFDADHIAAIDNVVR